MNKLYPMLLTPAFRHMVWGGDKLKKIFNKPLSSETIGESWEVACRNDLWSIIANGPLKGKSLPEVFKEYSEEILGKKSESFPWLIKFIDAKNTLSVQVHPDDEYAIPNGDFSGKTEMWYIVQADKNSKLILGFNQDVTREMIEQKAGDGTIQEILNEIQVKEGDSFFIPPGTVHAICEGLVILEIQQNSDATYRLYDWGRMGDDNKPRPLHIKKAADVANMKKSLPKPDETTILENGDILLSKCEFFQVAKRKVCGVSAINGMSVVILLKGSIQINDLSIKEGDCVLIPYSLGEVQINGNGEVILVY